MPKIITVTANTAIDFVMEVDEFILGDNIAALSSIEFAAGKGINVAKSLESLAHPVTALGFVGEQSRSVFEALNSPLLQAHFSFVDGKTRTNITLVTISSGQETHIKCNGFALTAEDCRELCAKLKAQTASGDIVVFSGGLPLGAPNDFYNGLIEQCHSQGALAFLDTSGEPLKTALIAQPDLIKPNLQELEALVDNTLADEQAIIDAAQAILSQGVKYVVVSRGSKGALLITKKQILSATLTHNVVPIQSSIGCGDAMVAGFALSILGRYDLKTTLSLAVACGTANLFTLEPGRFDRHKVATIMGQISLGSF